MTDSLDDNTLSNDPKFLVANMRKQFETINPKVANSKEMEEYLEFCEQEIDKINRDPDYQKSVIHVTAVLNAACRLSRKQSSCEEKASLNLVE